MTGKRATTLQVSSEILQVASRLYSGTTRVDVLSPLTSAPNVLADWRVRSNYPPSECNDMKRWAWEFLRRNEEYQKDAALMLGLPIDWQLRLRRPTNADLRSSEEELRSTATAMRVAILLSKSGGEEIDGSKVHGVPLSPLRIFRNKWFVKHAFDHIRSYESVSQKRPLSEQERAVLKRSKKEKKRLNFPVFQIDTLDTVSYTHSVLKPSREGHACATLAQGVNWNAGEAKRFTVLPNEGGFKFFFNAKMKPQLRQAEKWFEAHQKRYRNAIANGWIADVTPRQQDAGGDKDFRVRTETFLLMLRVYDAAFEAGTHHQETLPVNVRKELSKVLLLEAYSSRQIHSAFKAAKRYIEKGGHVAAAHHDYISALI